MPRTIGPVEGTDVCPTCLAVIEPGQHFCRHCASPLTPIASTDPIGSIYAQGDLYRKAVAHPRKLIVLLGVWLICGPAALGGIGAFVWFVADALRQRRPFPDASHPSSNVFFASFMLVFGLLFATILFRVTRNYAWQADEPAEADERDDDEDEADATEVTSGPTEERA